MSRARLSAVAVAALLAGGCARNPATGERQLMLVDERREIALGQDADRQVTARLGLVADEALQAYVTRVGRRLAAHTERPELPWSFRVVDDAAVNAFALPGGYVYVTRGLLAHLDSEAELAAVIGHEIGHVTARHSTCRTSQARVAALGLGLGALVDARLGSHLDLAAAGVGIAMLKLGRDDEREADLLGLRYLARTGYPTRAVLSVLRMLARVEERGGGTVGRDWRSTHPQAAERARAIAQLVDGRGHDDRVGFLHAIDGLPFGTQHRRALPAEVPLSLTSSCFDAPAPPAPALEQPARLQVLDVGPLRLSEIAEVYPSVVSNGTVAVLNGVDPGSADAVLPQPMKRVVAGE